MKKKFYNLAAEKRVCQDAKKFFWLYTIQGAMYVAHELILGQWIHLD